MEPYHLRLRLAVFVCPRSTPRLDCIHKTAHFFLSLFLFFFFFPRLVLHFVPAVLDTLETYRTADGMILFKLVCKAPSPARTRLSRWWHAADSHSLVVVTTVGEWPFV